MSNVERRLGGVWSCLYCESVWLPNLSTDGPADVGLIRSTESGGVTETNPVSAPAHLVCPQCESKSFDPTSVKHLAFFSCHRCGGVFLPKGLIQSFAPGAVRAEDQANVPEALISFLATALLGAPEILVSQLNRTSKRG
jgi:ribosomal protein L37AE/L43A